MSSSRVLADENPTLQREIIVTALFSVLSGEKLDQFRDQEEDEMNRDHGLYMTVG